jgi:hypothetical protein
MTGFHTGHARIRGNSHNSIQASDVTVAELLQQAGYRTALIGKWGLGEEQTPGAPHRKGFDESFGYLNQVHAHKYYTDYLIKNGEKVPVEGNANDGRKTYSTATPSFFSPATTALITREASMPIFSKAAGRCEGTNVTFTKAVSANLPWSAGPAGSSQGQAISRGHSGIFCPPHARLPGPKRRTKSTAFPFCPLCWAGNSSRIRFSTGNSTKAVPSKRCGWDRGKLCG